MSAKNSTNSRDIQQLAKLAIDGSYREVRQLATEALVKAQDDRGRTVLMLTANAQVTPIEFAKCLELFLHLGADPCAADAAGDTAAHLAARCNNLRLLALLPFESKWKSNGSGLSPLMVAAQEGNWASAKHLLHLLRQRQFSEKNNEKRLGMLGMKSSSGRTASDLAIEQGHADLASVIQREMRLQVDRGGGNLSGLSASEQAERRALERLVRAPEDDEDDLQSVATRVNCDLPDTTGITVLMMAAGISSCDEASFQVLVKVADLTCANVAGWSCLHWAARHGRPDLVRILLAAGAHANARDVEGRTPLMSAVWSSASTAVAPLLLPATDWRLRNREGLTALQMAASMERSKWADLLRGYKGKSYFDETVEFPVKSHAVTDDVYEQSATDSDEAKGAQAPKASATKPKTRQVSAAKPQNPQASSAAASRTSRPLSSQIAQPQLFGFYPVTSPQGICHIINIDRYSPRSGFTDRKGSEVDVTRVRALFKKLDFNVRTEDDLKGHEISQTLQKMAHKDHSQFGVFVCFLMGHGTSDSIYGSDGVHQNLKSLAAPFGANSCPSLAHKPKIFFIQACRGQQAEVAKEKTDSGNAPSPLKDQCPSKSDFLFCFASSEDAPAYRDPDNGSVFIQTLCDVIESGFKTEHLVDLMAGVNGRLKRNPVAVKSHRGKEMYFHVVTDLHSQLERKVSLKPRDG